MNSLGEVINVCPGYLRDHDNASFSEHDGWRCRNSVDTAELAALVYERTGYKLAFKRS